MIDVDNTNIELLKSKRNEKHLNRIMISRKQQTSNRYYHFSISSIPFISVVFCLSIKIIYYYFHVVHGSWLMDPFAGAININIRTLVQYEFKW